MDPNLSGILARVSQREGVPPTLLLGILASMGAASGKPDFTRIEHDLLRKAGDFLALRGRLQTPSGRVPEIDALRSGAAQALEQGRLAEADRLLAQAEQRNLDETTAGDAATRERLLLAAAYRTDRGDVAMLRLTPQAYRDAATRYAEAALIAASTDPALARVLGWKQADALARLGADFRDRSGFSSAIAHLQALLAKLDPWREPVHFAEIRLRLGRSITGLSHLDADIGQLRHAAEIYRETLEDLPRDKAPGLWATLQGRLGEALARLGEHDDDAEQLEQSVAALRAAIAGIDRQRLPREWARQQFELGKTYVALGLRASGAAALESAVNCFNLVLQDWTRALTPLDWADVQDRIGAALTGLAAYYREPVVLEEAIAACDAALLERRRETVPTLWAKTVANRGEARLRLAALTRERAQAELAATELMQAVETLRGLSLAEVARPMEPLLIRAATLVKTLPPA